MKQQRKVKTVDTAKAINMLNVSKEYSGHKVVDGINLTISRGEILGLVGPNGAGKTTLMSIILGLNRNFSGDVIVDGQNIKSNKTHSKKMGCLIEYPSLYPNLTGYENLKYFSTFIGKNQKNNIKDIVDFLKLKKFINKKTKTYSLGMKQRLGIAIALLGEPDYLVLDEPMNGIDAKLIPNIRTILKDFAHNKNKGIIVSSHVLSEIEVLCDRVVILKEGQIIKHINLKQDKKTTSAANYIISTPEKNQVKNHLIVEQYLVKDYKDDLMIILPDGNIEKLLKILVLKGFRINQISKFNSVLEDDFLEALNGKVQ